MKVAVVGYGSIGKRHARILAALGHQVHIVSRQPLSEPRVHSTVSDLLIAEPTCGYVVVANPTASHHAVVVELADRDFRGQVLIEKPMWDQERPYPQNSFASCLVGYNLRLHPVLRALRQALVSESVISVSLYAGMYLPEWRPERDYRLSYSVAREAGGGVLRDLSHELDYCRWLFGEWRRIVARGGHGSDLDGSADDHYTLIVESVRCSAIAIQLNCLDRAGRRQLVVNTKSHTFTADLIASTLQVDRCEPEMIGSGSRDYTYVMQHEAILSAKIDQLCSVEEGEEVMRMIMAAERSDAEGRWIARC